MLDKRIGAQGRLPAGMTVASSAPGLLWPREVQDFAPWLAENIGLLGQCLGVKLQITGREAPVGQDLRADIVATDDLGRMVIVEAQLGYSDHTHLGQLVTYAAVTDADVVVWVMATRWADGAPFRLDHVEALSMLNKSLAGKVQFLAVEVTVDSDLYPTGAIKDWPPPMIPRLRLLQPGRLNEPDRAFPPLIDMTSTTSTSATDAKG